MFPLLRIKAKKYETHHCPLMLPEGWVALGERPSNSYDYTLRLHGKPWGVKPTCFKAPGVSLGGSGVSKGGVRILRV